jgi:hypothetical protein
LRFAEVAQPCGKGRLRAGMPPWRQSVCHSKTKHKHLFIMDFLTLQRSISHWFRRSGETEMEQLFQMATERSDDKANRAAITAES